MPELTMTPPSIPASAAPSTPSAQVLGKTSQNPPDPAKASGAGPAKTAEVSINPDKLGEWAKLNRTIREQNAALATSKAEAEELKKKAAEADGFRDPAAKLAEATKLMGEGKHLAAMKLIGAKLEDAFAQWVEDNETNPAPAPPPAELLELKAKYELLEKRAAAEDDAKKKAADEASAADSKAQRDGVIKELGDKIAANPTRWARCGKDAAEAANDATGIAAEKARQVLTARAAEHGFDLSKSLTPEQFKAIALSDEDSAELFELALDAAEENYKSIADKWHVAPAAKPTATVRRIEDYFRKTEAAPTREGSPVAERKVAVTLDGQRGSLRGTREQETKGKLSTADALTKALASARSLRSV